MTQPSRKAAFTATGAYERYMGRWSREVAVEFLDWIRVPASGRWLDVGCGTGALSEAVLFKASPKQLLDIDPSRSFIAHAHPTVPDDRSANELEIASDLRNQPHRHWARGTLAIR